MLACETTNVVELALRLKNGDRSALTEAYRRWADLVHTTVLTALPPDEQEAAAEVTAAAFVKVWEERQHLRVSDHALPAWLVGSVHRLVHERGEVRRAALRTNPQAESDDRHAEHQRIDATRAFLVAEVLQQLPETRATVMHEAFAKHRPFTEIGADLALSAEAVEFHLRRGMTFVRRCVQEVDHVPA